jgi:hypothetical protein
VGAKRRSQRRLMRGQRGRPRKMPKKEEIHYAQRLKTRARIMNDALQK